MKNKSLFSSLALVILLSLYTTLNMSYSGVGAGSFNSYSGTSCPTCHGNSAATSINITGIPTFYNHGQTYPLSVTVSNSSMIIGGFQVRANIGTMTASDPGITIYSDNKSAGHNSPKAMNAGVATFNVNWTAPTSGSTNANFGAQGIGANGNGAASGDGGSFITISNIPLPVQFVSVQAIAHKNEIAVTFQTKNEQNIQRFDIERKTADSEYQTIATLKPTGNSIYEYTDERIEKNTKYYYRIVEVDVEQKKSYSEVVNAIVRTQNMISISPTIIVNHTIDLNGIAPNELKEYTLEVYNLLGKRVFQLPQLSANQVNINQLVTGMYIVLMKRDKQKVLIQKITKTN